MTIYRLYVKTHNQTGLKYLGQTIKENPHEYPGSGTRWINHLKKHGYDYTTEILLETNSKEELSEKGLFYSELWDVVNNTNWANLKPETGPGGGVISMSLESREKISKVHKGKPKGPQSAEHRAKVSESKKGCTPWNKGKSSWRKGIPLSAETKAKISAALKGKSKN